MIENGIGRVHVRYQSNRIALGLGIDSNALNMMGDIRTHGLVKGVPQAMSRHNRHFTYRDSNNGVCDALETTMICGINMIMAGLVALFGVRLSYVLPKDQKNSK